MARHKDYNWSVPAGDKNFDGSISHSWESIRTSLLLDIRDELKLLNKLLYCPNFIGMPSLLSRIAKNTAKKRRRPK